MAEKRWDAGKRLAVAHRDTHPDFPRGVVDIQMPVETARKVALSLMKLRQTTLMVSPEVVEFLDALNYVLVGDPGSVGAHRRMEAGKGMEPAAGDPRSYAAVAPGDMCDCETGSKGKIFGSHARGILGCTK